MGYLLEARDWEVSAIHEIAKNFHDLSLVGGYPSIIPHRISDSIWTAHGSLLVGAGPHMLLYGQLKPQSTTPLIEGANSKPTEREGLWEYVARENGPLEQFHPQMLLQCLLWGTDQCSPSASDPC